MARGKFEAVGTISSNTDTAVIAAPGTGERIYILWLTIDVSVAGTTSRLRVEDGVGGGVIGRLATTTADAILGINYATGFRDWPGRPLTENTALNINTSGGAAATVNYDIGYEVK
jgi:hypothetical protein